MAQDHRLKRVKPLEWESCNEGDGGEMQTCDIAFAHGPTSHNQQSHFFDGSPFCSRFLFCIFGSSDARHGSTEKRQARARPIGDLPMLDSLGGKGVLASLGSLLGTCAGMNEVVKSIKCLDASFRIRTRMLLHHQAWIIDASLT